MCVCVRVCVCGKRIDGSEEVNWMLSVSQGMRGFEG